MCDRNFEPVASPQPEWMRDTRARPRNEPRVGGMSSGCSSATTTTAGAGRGAFTSGRSTILCAPQPIDDLARRSSGDLFRVVCGRRIELWLRPAPPGASAHAAVHDAEGRVVGWVRPTPAAAANGAPSTMGCAKNGRAPERSRRRRAPKPTGSPPAPPPGSTIPVETTLACVASRATPTGPSASRFGRARGASSPMTPR